MNYDKREYRQSVNDALEQHYRVRDEDGRLLTVCGRVEYLTTKTYIRNYFPKGSKLLEVGAGTGKYSIALAKEGYDVTAVELLTCNIQKFKENLSGDENLHLCQGNALDLSDFGNDSFDGVLLLGPMYHLYCTEDKVQALREAKRVVKPGGIIMVAYVGNESVILIDLFNGNGDALMRKINNGRIDQNWKMLTQPPMEFNEKIRLEEIDELNSEVGLSRRCIVSADGLTALIEEKAASWSDEVFEKYMDWHLTVCERKDCIGFANHILDVLEKEIEEEQP